METNAGYAAASSPSGMTTRMKGAIDKRHSIYYDDQTGTLAAAYYFRDIADQEGIKYITLDGKASVEEVTDELVKKLEA